MLLLRSGMHISRSKYDTRVHDFLINLSNKVPINITDDSMLCHTDKEESSFAPRRFEFMNNDIR